MIFFEQARQILQASESIVTSSEKERVRKPQNYFNIVQRRFRKRSQRDAISSHVNTSPTNSIEKAIVKTESVTFEDPSGAASSAQPSQRKDLTKEDVAAIKIQAIFRGHHVCYSIHFIFSLDILFIDNSLVFIINQGCCLNRQGRDFKHVRAM